MTNQSFSQGCLFSSISEIYHLNSWCYSESFLISCPAFLDHPKSAENLYAIADSFVLPPFVLFSRVLLGCDHRLIDL